MAAAQKFFAETLCFLPHSAEKHVLLRKEEVWHCMQVILHNMPSIICHLGMVQCVQHNLQSQEMENVCLIDVSEKCNRRARWLWKCHVSKSQLIFHFFQILKNRTSSTVNSRNRKIN